MVMVSVHSSKTLTNTEDKETWGERRRKEEEEEKVDEERRREKKNEEETSLLSMVISWSHDIPGKGKAEVGTNPKC